MNNFCSISYDQMSGSFENSFLFVKVMMENVEYTQVSENISK